MIRGIIYMSRLEAEALLPKENWACISISTPGDGLAELREGWFAIHRTYFHDIDTRTSGLIQFNLHIARQIIEFVRVLDDEDKDVVLIIHCDAGISRSGAVALFINEWFAPGIHLNPDSSLYNRHVRRTLEEAAGTLGLQPPTRL